jgi:hypothetical protein
MHTTKVLSLLVFLGAGTAWSQTVTVTMPGPNLTCKVGIVTTSTFTVVSAAVAITNGATISSFQGLPLKTTFGDFAITKNSDACSVGLFASVVTASSIQGNLVVNYYAAGTVTDKTLPVLTVLLTNIIFTSVSLTATGSEVFTVTYQGIKIYDPATKASTCWDRTRDSTSCLTTATS